MMSNKLFIKKIQLISMISALFIFTTEGIAQHRGGGARRAAPSRPAVSHSRPAAASHNVSRPAQSKPNVKRPTANKTSGIGNNSKISNNNREGLGNKTNSGSKIKNSNNRTNNIGNKNISGNKVGNKVNVDKSRKNVNVNIDNSKHVKFNNNRNTVVRRNNVRPYTRPPYVYGGYRYHAYHPYYPRPYRPFYWGPVWHPWGFFLTTLAVTAVVVSVENAQYHYDQGVWYQSYNNGYQAVPAPVGGTVNNIPSGAETVNTGTVNNYYYGGTYYEKSGGGYTVVAPTAGTIVDQLPEGGEEVTMGDVTYVKFGETYYQPVQVDGKDKYEVVLVEEDK